MHFAWEEGDYFVVPNWAWYEHVAAEDSYLFSVDDLPIMERFQFEQAQAWETGTIKPEVVERYLPLYKELLLNGY